LTLLTLLRIGWINLKRDRVVQALDGYIKVFWRGAPLSELWPQVLVLTSLVVVFLVASRRLARRWETA
jgi:hypothetical protein